MKFVIQKVSQASVSVEGTCIGKISQGFLVFVGIGKEDTKELADQYIKKMVQLRIFQDENGKTNRSLADVNGEVLIISQFTLYADCKKGNRPSFSNALHPDYSRPLYLFFNDYLRKQGVEVGEGVFGADMKIDLLNDGPVTIIMDSREL